MANFPLSLLFLLTALSSADSSKILHHVAPPQPPLLMGLTSKSPSPNPEPILSPSSNSNPPTLTFFLHDILGGTHPTARTVTGGTTGKAEPTSAAAARLPFSKPKNNIFPLPGGVPLISTNRNSNGVNSQRYVTFGALTTIDDELTEGEELGTAVIGRAQGFYFVSSFDGSSHTVALTVIVRRHDGDEEDTISFFGVHRIVTAESPIAVVGGTGKYENVGGFAVMENLRRRENQHLTDGADTIVHFSVYLS